uniref:Uncharacterized protein n=1 Tax=Oryza rufipogon TaxID=4529 RepID=A0A0E0PL95_ORYRU
MVLLPTMLLLRLRLPGDGSWWPWTRARRARTRSPGASPNVVSSSSGDTLVPLHARRPRPVYATMDSSGYMMTSDVMASMDKYAAVSFQVRQTWGGAGDCNGIGHGSVGGGDREMEDMTCGPKDILELSRAFSLLFSQKLLF